METFYNIEAEQSVLGAVLLEPVTVLNRIDLNYKNFYAKAHRYIADGIQTLHEAETAVDLGTLS